MEKVLIINSDYENIKNNIKKIFDLFPLEVRGKNVLVKPNILGPFDKERGITTHPALVNGVISYLENAGAKIIVGDNPGFRGYGMNRKSAEISGILEVAGKYYKNIGAQVKSIKVKSRYFDEVVVSQDVLDCDILISLPKFKTHINTVITGGIKNMYGILEGSEKARVHRLANKEFAEAVVDIYQIRLPDLVIMDAVVGMEGDGPNSKDLRKIGKLIASYNSVCLDAVMAEMMGVDADSVTVLRVANQRNLGEIDIRKINIIGNLEKIPDFKLPSNFVIKKKTFRFYDSIINYFITRLKLVIDRKKCKKCLICLEHCPVMAISKKEFIYIDNKICIKCYCCKEVCLYDAVKVKGAIEMVRRLIDK